MYWFIALAKPKINYSKDDGEVKRGLVFKSITECYDHMYISGGVPVYCRSSHFTKNGSEVFKFKCRFSKKERKPTVKSRQDISAPVNRKTDIVFICPFESKVINNGHDFEYLEICSHNHPENFTSRCLQI